MSVCEGLEFETAIEGDTTPLHELVRAMLGTTKDLRCLRHPTSRGLPATLNEIASRSHVGIAIEESVVPVNPAVRSACELQGFDPLLVANAGKLIAVMPSERIC